ncbi:Blue-light photoreceptor PHR2 [Abeliophyllum distichum]|uniref:Blue-light photoreceptor PHR2 n=1 Tax=Abeliophyllum distichum TaxID=126358 RepID=A0ABD1RUC6_9LAMI
MSAKKFHPTPPLPSLPRTLPYQVPKSLTTTPPLPSLPRTLPYQVPKSLTTTFLRRNHQCHHHDLLLSSPVSTTTPISYPKSSTISSNPLQSSLTLNLFRPSEPSNVVALRRTSIFWFWNDLRAYDRNCEIGKIGEGCGDTGGVVLGCGLSDCRGGPALVRVR